MKLNGRKAAVAAGLCAVLALAPVAGPAVALADAGDGAQAQIGLGKIAEPRQGQTVKFSLLDEYGNNLGEINVPYGENILNAINEGSVDLDGRVVDYWYVKDINQPLNPEDTANEKLDGAEIVAVYKSVNLTAKDCQGNELGSLPVDVGTSILDTINAVVDEDVLKNVFLIPEGYELTGWLLDGVPVTPSTVATSNMANAVLTPACERITRTFTLYDTKDNMYSNNPDGILGTVEVPVQFDNVDAPNILDVINEAVANGSIQVPQIDGYQHVGWKFKNNDKLLDPNMVALNNIDSVLYAYYEPIEQSADTQPADTAVTPIKTNDPKSDAALAQTGDSLLPIAGGLTLLAGASAAAVVAATRARRSDR